MTRDDAEFQRALDAAIARFERALASTAPVADRAIDTLIEVQACAADRDAVEADLAMQQLLDRLRAGELSRDERTVLAREIAAKLDDVERAIGDARAACDAAARDVAEWTRLRAIAVEQNRPDLADGAQSRVSFAEANVEATAAVMHEHVELQGLLRELGRVLLAAT